MNKTKICVVACCRKDSVRFPGVTFFNLPRDPCAKSEWLDALGLKPSEASQSIKVCEQHFKPKDFCASRKQLKIHALPVLNLGVGKSEPFDSDDEFMNSDNDEELLEAKRITAAIMESKIKEEPPEEKPETVQEPETGRRPSRRAAREAAKKIYNTVRNYGCAPDDADDDLEIVTSVSRSTTSPRSAQRQRSRVSQAVRVPPPNIDLIMECHEELLSTIQAEALLQAQLQYNMVMKTLRSLKANNVKIICASADDPIPVEVINGNAVSSINKESDNSHTAKCPNIVTLQAVKKENIPVPMELSTSIPSPGPSILS